MWIITTIVLCLWAIALEARLRRRDRDVFCLADLLTDVVDGKKIVARKGNKFTVTNRGVK